MLLHQGLPRRTLLRAIRLAQPMLTASGRLSADGALRSTERAERIVRTELLGPRPGLVLEGGVA
jgi:hypothetical protein